MKKIHTNHPLIIMKKDDWTADKNPFRRVLSIACIAGAIVFVGAAAGCTANTTETTQATSAEAETTDTAAADLSAEPEVVEETVDDTAANAADETTVTDTAADNTATDTAANTGAEITLDEAKAIALADAGLNEADVTYTAEGQDYDNGVAVYELDFYTTATEYDYEIQISDGAILKRSTEAYHAGSDTAGTTTSSCISVEEAKSIVLNHAGLTESDVTLRKAMLERDDGIMVYEFEFYHGRTEYEYTVNAVTGDILEYDRD